MTALRYAGYFFTSILPGFVASGNPSANGASPSAGLGSTFDAAGLGSSARVEAEATPSKANGKNRARWHMIRRPQVCWSVTHASLLIVWVGDRFVKASDWRLAAWRYPWFDQRP